MSRNSYRVETRSLSHPSFESLEGRQFMSVGTTSVVALPAPEVQPGGNAILAEDGDVHVPTDFGDAPNANYRTLLANNGARHTILPGFFLGNGVDAEPDGQPSNSALRDDFIGADDEDGVNMPAAFVPGNAYVIQVKSSAAGRLDAWIDWNRNRQFDGGPERIAAGMAVAAGINNVVVNVPVGIGFGGTYARFRLSQNGVALPYGAGGFGEVEDYHTKIAPPGGWGGGGGHIGDVALDATGRSGSLDFSEQSVEADVLGDDSDLI